MFFYRFKCSSENKTDEKTKVNIKADKAVCDRFCEEKLEKDMYFAIVEDEKDYISFAIIYNGPLNELDTVDQAAKEFLGALGKNFEKIEKAEITFDSLSAGLEIAVENNFIKSCNDVKRRFNLDFENRRFFRERRIDKKESTKDEILSFCDETALNDQVKEEIERIYTPRQENSFGVPVHYILDMENEIAYDTIDALIRSLRANGRMIRDKYIKINLSMFLSSLDPFGFQPLFVLQTLFDMNEGGVVLLSADFEIDESNKYSEEIEILKSLCRVIKTRSKKTTTIFHSYSSKGGQVEFIKNELSPFMPLVEIQDKSFHGKSAKNFLLRLAKDAGIKGSQGLTDLVDPDKFYEPFELTEIFREWHNNFVVEVQFPQYAKFLKQEHKEEKLASKNPAFKDLNDLIGLDGVKEVVTNFINYSKLQRSCSLQGKKSSEVCRHMSFIGNPGTAKTTVARIVAQIMKEEGLLSNGKLIEVGRADIVSKFVGGTAPKVKELFKRAIGNVLFIDEAYSLYDGDKGLYGDEAINAIVQEMENNRENLVVIFAGYKKEMQDFLDRNSGLRSRIAFEIEFPDYSEKDLLKIAEFQAKNMDVDISSCEERFKEVIAKGKESKNFGNGRFVRNVLEKARMKQATRLVKENKLNTPEVGILLPEDIEMPTEVSDKNFMGFRM